MVLPLLRDGEMLGDVSIQRDGRAVVLTATCSCPLDGIWRAYLTDGEFELPIGVMAPCENGFSARKSYWENQWEENKLTEECYGILHFGRAVELSQLQWLSCHKPEALFQDAVLAKTMVYAARVLVDCYDRPTRVAIPLDCARACVPALCLAHVMEYRGISYAVLGIDRLGNPKTL